MHISLLVIQILLFFFSHVRGNLIANDIGKAYNLSDISSRDVCTNRSYCDVLLDVPPKCAGATSSCPIIIGLHGHGGRNIALARPTGRFGISDGVHKYNFIGVYPQGQTFPVIPVPGQRSLPGWSDGDEPGDKCAWDDFNCTGDPNDTIFIAKIISALVELGAKGRFYAWGVSNGAAMVQRLGANIGPQLPFVGLGAHSGQMLSNPERSGPNPYNYNKPHDGISKVAQLSIHGTADTLVPYSGGPRFGSNVFSWYSEPQSDKTWAQHNGCNGVLSQKNVSAVYSHSGANYSTTAVHYMWKGCPDDAPVEYYKVIGSGHTETMMLNGIKKEFIVFEFFTKIENYHSLAHQL